MSQYQKDRVDVFPRPVNLLSFAAEFLVDNDRIIVTAQGRLDISSGPTMVAALAKVIASDQREVVIDLAGVNYVDSKGVELLVRARRVLQDRGQLLNIRSASTDAQSLFPDVLLELRT